MSGLQKLTIIAFSKDDFSESSRIGSFEALINPETLKRDVEIQYSDSGPINSAGNELRFSKVESERLSFKLVLDGTGLIPTAPASLKDGNKIKPVDEQLKKLRNITSNYNGDIHRPNFLKLSWGKTLFDGVLTSLGITYKLFSPSGAVLRAEVDLAMSSSISNAMRKAEAQNKSPDVTHLVTVKARERLPALCNDIYEGANYYVQVAKANNLDAIRGISSGTLLSFPPLID